MIADLAARVTWTEARRWPPCRRAPGGSAGRAAAAGVGGGGALALAELPLARARTWPRDRALAAGGHGVGRIGRSASGSS